VHTVVDLDLPVPPERVWSHISDLAAYPAWMRLVHRVDEVASDDHRARWDVELRAKVGPFARSKRLRMARTVYEPNRVVRFERSEFDGRDHAEWVLTATLEAVDHDACRLSMDLRYGGRLWTAGVLDRVLETEIRTGKDSLLRAVDQRPIG
jgi:uncharacterized protein YndB with AHSA1/START domain